MSKGTIKMTEMFKQYFNTQIEYEKRFGKKVCVLMQCGGFYEIYGLTSESGKIKYGNASTISDVLNIQKTKKWEYDMLGFPVHATKRFIEVLIKNGYTVVVIDQTTPPPNPKREITRVVSTGTYIDDVTDFNNSNLLSLYLEEVKNDYLVGLSMIDLTTGKSSVYEYGNSDLDSVIGELFRFIESNSVKEIIVNSKGIGDEYIKQVESLMINSKLPYYFKQENVKSDIYKLSYQNKFLSKIFKDCGLLTPLEYIDLCYYPLTVISYILLIQFAYEHDEKIVASILRPKIWCESDHMILSHNTLYQLDVIEYKNKYDSDTLARSLYNVLNKCYTAMGRRLLKERLLNPIVDPIKLEERYTQLDKFIKMSENEEEKFNIVSSYLDNIIDVERLVRKLILKKLAPNAFSESWISFESIKMIFSIFNSITGDEDRSYYQLDKNMLDKYYLFMKNFASYFDKDEMLNHNMVNINGSFFKKGIFKEVDDLQKKFDDNYEKLVNIQKKLSDMLENKIEVDICSNSNDGYFLKTTTMRSNLIKKELKKRGELDNYQFKKKNSGSSICRIYSDDIIDLSSNLMTIKEELAEVTHQKYLETLEMLGNNYGEILDLVVKSIAEIDLLISYVKVSQKYGYCRPIISSKDSEESYLNGEQIRHPVIERILTDYPYVPNSLELSEKNGLGLLLYGINGSGKSSLAKAIGLNIIMAQMGMYVSAKKFSFYPFKTIFTRISDGDNIFKGYSSFAVEMNDLRGLIRYGDKWSLVLGDEVCKGTENVSAVSIVAASLQHFVEKGVKFIFATHLHQLPKLDCIKKLGDSIKVKHLSVTCNDGEIIYGRRLFDGQGPSVYGLEVAKHIIHNDKFILNAEKIRKQLMGINNKLLEEKNSKYNSDLYVDQCEICGSKEDLDVHHIKFQSECNKQGLYKHIPKNIIGNLVVLCKNDHVSVHGGKITIKGWLESSKRRKLDWHKSKIEEIKKIKRGRLKYNEEDVKEIMKSKEMRKVTSMKNILIWLKEKGYKLSSQTLKKIWDEKYFE